MIIRKLCAFTTVRMKLGPLEVVLSDQSQWQAGDDCRGIVHRRTEYIQAFFRKPMFFLRSLVKFIPAYAGQQNSARKDTELKANELDPGFEVHWFPSDKVCTVGMKHNPPLRVHGYFNILLHSFPGPATVIQTVSHDSKKPVICANYPQVQYLSIQPYCWGAKISRSL